MSDPERLAKLISCRKTLTKGSANSEVAVNDLAKASNLVLDSTSEHYGLESLSLLAVILRQLRSALPSPDVIQLVVSLIAPAFQPGGPLAGLAITSAKSESKPLQQRATDTISAAGHLAAAIGTSAGPDEGTFMVPFLRKIIASGVGDRQNLHIISLLLDQVPHQSIPSTLLGSLLADINLNESAATRSILITTMLKKRRQQCLSTTEEDQNRYMLDPLLPYFDPSLRQPSTLVYMSRYLLPLLFKAVPSAVTTLLTILDTSSDTTYVEHAGPSTLSHRPTHDNFSAWVTVAALGVASGLVEISDLDARSLDDALAHSEAGVRLRAFELLVGGKGLPSEKVVHLLKESMIWNEILPSAEGRQDMASAFHGFFSRLKVAERAAIKLSQKQEKEHKSTYLGVHRWFLENYIDTNLPTIRKGPTARPILALMLFSVYIDVFGSQPKDVPVVFTTSRIDLLLDCQSSDFSEIRSRARDLIESGPVPLPGYDSLTTKKTQTLLETAFTSLNLPRNTQAETGKATLCIVFNKIVRPLDNVDQEASLAYIGTVIAKLEEHLQASERDLVRGIESFPLHGLLAATRDVISCLALTTSCEQTIWAPTFRQLFSIVDRVWTITSPVISLSTSQTGMVEHEIARANEVLGGDEGEEEDHTGLLSGCWRATKEAGDLLSTVITSPFLCLGEKQIVWTKEDVAKAGDTFLIWLHEIRHRGTFSKIAPAFAKVVDAIRPVGDLSSLSQLWLHTELEMIANDKLSTTRRSAALPYSVLSIVYGDKALLDQAVTALSELAKVDSPSSDITKVHAFNILKIVLLDARQTRLFSRYFEQVVMVAVRAFSSANWNVRNVGLIVFSTMVNRSLSSGQSQDLYKSRSTLSQRQTFINWHKKYPSIIPFVIVYLKESEKSDLKSNTHSPLFPILIILRSLRWSEEGRQIQAQLKEAVRPHLNSPDWRVREVSAQALSSLTSVSEAWSEAVSIVRSCQTPAHDTNLIHGNLLLLERLITDVIDWTKPPCTFGDELVSLLECVKLQSPILLKTALDCILALNIWCSPPPDLQDKALDIAKSALRDRSSPGNDLLLGIAAKIISAFGPSFNLLSHELSEDVKLVALDSIMERGEITDLTLLEKIIGLAMDGKQGNAVKIRALEVLSSAKLGILIPTLLERLVSYLSTLVSRTRCVPLKEAGLPALGWCLAQVHDNQDLKMLASFLETASDEEQSEPSRSSALLCLQHLTPFIFSSPDVSLCKTLLRLLQDDDEDIREGATSIVVAGLTDKICRSKVQTKGLVMFWAWLEQHLGGLEDHQKREWSEWLEVLAKGPIGMLISCPHDPAHASPETTTPRRADTEILFEVEPPNLFRDPNVDAAHAQRLLVFMNM
ncbi:thyroid adenoma-associated protein, partial [Tremellales sp. Uapishka_1]